MQIGSSPSFKATLIALAMISAPLGLSWDGMAGKAAQAADPPSTAQRRGSGLPIPRFASLRSDEVNVRTGPGSRYPVDWVFKRKSMPVEIVAEYENWRKVRDWQGASGWVHQSLLTGKRSFLISAKTADLHKTPASSAPVVAKLGIGRPDPRRCTVAAGSAAYAAPSAVPSQDRPTGGQISNNATKAAFRAGDERICIDQVL